MSEDQNTQEKPSFADQLDDMHQKVQARLDNLVKNIEDGSVPLEDAEKQKDDLIGGLRRIDNALNRIAGHKIEATDDDVDGNGE